MYPDSPQIMKLVLEEKNGFHGYILFLSLVDRLDILHSGCSRWARGILHPFFKICIGYLSTYASPIKSTSSSINPTLDFLPLIYLICYMIMFHHGLYAPHLSPFSNFHAKFLPNPMVKDHSFTLPLYYGTTYHTKSILPIMWKFLNPC